MPPIQPDLFSCNTCGQAYYRDGVWLDLGDMGRNTRATEFKRLVYVAITRTGSKIYVTGALPERYGSCTS